MDDEREVPLFPLPVVLMPGMALPLHIFEPRYLQMMADCLDSDLPIGVVLAPADRDHPATPASVGTLARIMDYERLPDGQYNLFAIGTERFEVIASHTRRPYLSGRIRILRDEPERRDLSALTSTARDALTRYLRLVLAAVGSEDCEIPVPSDAEELSFVVAMCLDCDDGEKQRLLELRSAGERLRRGVALLRIEIDALADPHDAPRGHRLARDDRNHLN